MERAKIVRVVVEQGKSGLLHATSREFPELFVSGDSIEELEIAVPRVIEAIYEAHGEVVSVIEADEEAGPNARPWVVVPKHSLRQPN